MERFFLSASAVSGFVAVILGAFAAHGLKSHLDEYFLKVFHTGVAYHFYHTFALALVGVLAARGENTQLKFAGYAFLFGIVVFSGSLYILALTKTKAWGAVTPFGGVGFLIGWAGLFVAVLKKG